MSAAAHHTGDYARDELENWGQRIKNIFPHQSNFISHSSKDRAPNHDVGKAIC